MTTMDGGNAARGRSRSRPCTSAVPLSTQSYDSMDGGGRAKHGARAEGFPGTLGSAAQAEPHYEVNSFF